MSVKLSLVVPCYNEEDNVENFFLHVKNGLKSYTDSYEIVFVNDGSRDKTEKKLKKLFEENRDTKITVVSFSRNFGKEAAMYAGLSEAKGDYVDYFTKALKYANMVHVKSRGVPTIPELKYKKVP